MSLRGGGAEGAPKAVHHCHCSMCRRWTGSAFATLAVVRARRRAMDGHAGRVPVIAIAVRTHCGLCGTPLPLTYDSRNDLALAVGSFDAPEAVTPTHHYGVESRIRWADIGAERAGQGDMGAMVTACSPIPVQPAQEGGIAWEDGSLTAGRLSVIKRMRAIARTHPRELSP